MPAILTLQAGFRAAVASQYDPTVGDVLAHVPPSTPNKERLQLRQALSHVQEQPVIEHISRLGLSWRSFRHEITIVNDTLRRLGIGKSYRNTKHLDQLPLDVMDACIADTLVFGPMDFANFLLSVRPQCSADAKSARPPLFPKSASNGTTAPRSRRNSIKPSKHG